MRLREKENEIGNINTNIFHIHKIMKMKTGDISENEMQLSILLMLIEILF